MSHAEKWKRFEALLRGLRLLQRNEVSEALLLAQHVKIAECVEAMRQA